MKKLIAVTVIAVLLCALLVTNVFAIAPITGPSIPTGISAITPAGYLLGGEIGNEEVKYTTNLPLGEITGNIAAAPSPNAAKKAAPVKDVVVDDVVEDIIEEEITEGFAFMQDDEVLNIYSIEELTAMVAEYDFSEAVMLPIEFAITAHEEDIVITLNEEEILIYLTPEGQGYVACNYTDAPLDIELAAGSYSLRCAFDIALDNEIALDVFVYCTFEGFIIINTMYMQYELGDNLVSVEFSVLFPDGYDDFVVCLTEYPPAE